MSRPNRKSSELPDVRATRLTLLVAAAAFVVLLGIVLLMLYTTAFSGTVGGIGVAYIVGFADFVLVLAVAGVYCVLQNRADDEADLREKGEAL